MPPPKMSGKSMDSSKSIPLNSANSYSMENISKLWINIKSFKE